MHTRSGLSLVATTQPQSPYRLATPVPMATTSITTTTTTSSVISSTTASSVAPSTSSAPMTSTLSVTSTGPVLVSSVITTPSTVTSSAATVTFASSDFPTAAASTVNLMLDPGIPGPGSFFGDGSQDPRDWFKTFQSWSNIKNFAEKTTIDVFKILMKMNAARWIDTLPSSDADTFDHLKAAFFKRFIDIDEWSDFVKMGQLRQEPQEPVITYLELALVLAKRVKLDEKHEIRALIEGLRPQIQTFVIQQKVQSFADLKEAALLAEKSFRPLSSTDDILSAVHRLEETIKHNVSPSSMPSVPQPSISAALATNDNQESPQRLPRPRYTANSTPQQFQPRRPRQPGSTWNGQNSLPHISGEQSQCYRCLRNHPSRECPFINAPCFFCGITGHIKAACRRRLASQNSQ